ncbi:RIP metalloprotease RseP [Uliginosibacterium sp. H3]|uniref:Zinc metalloprotease n=1 Tax=Uliginosibacterium silvisoli TaxID=3114758 RepID=A0ABU6K4M0_9RHOO|nr:RIP metalloprotease RseP [Uliginosibacterium sp. H3]
MKLLQTVLSFVFALGILVLIHELGHYLVARWCGVKVARFSLGFGKVVWSRRFGADQTEWAISALPLGGYVSWIDDQEGGVAPAEQHRTFQSQSLASRAMIVTAGPLANFLLAIVVYWALFLVGTTELAPVVGQIKSGSIAERAGLVSGERIAKVNGEAIQSWTDLRWAVMEGALDGRAITLDARSPSGAQVLHELPLGDVKIDDRQPDPMAQLGIEMPVPKLPPVVAEVVKGSVAERAGVLPGDEMLSVDGVAVPYFHEFAAAVARKPGQEIEVMLRRQGKELSLRMTPEAVKDAKPARGRIGIAPKIPADAGRENLVKVSYGPLGAISHALSQTWATTTFSLKVMWRMVTGEVSLRNVSGPITIADYAGKSAEAGLEPYITFIALISISLGVLNLLPVPILDGGYLLYYVVEFIRGKPVSERFMLLGQNVGIALLGGLMLLAFFNDINRQFPGPG